MTSTATSTEVLVAYPEAVALADLAPVTQPRSRVSRVSSDRPSSSAPSSASSNEARQNDPSKGESYLIIVCVAVITGISMSSLPINIDVVLMSESQAHCSQA